MTNLRNNGIIAENEYVGKTLEDATKYAEDGGFVVRIVEKDGNSFMLTADLRSNRINFRINHGYVIAAYGG